jgi:hypothetical protein
MTKQNVFVVKIIYFSAFFPSWGDDRREISVRVAPSTGLLNSLNKQEAWTDKRGEGRKRTSSIQTEEVVGVSGEATARGKRRNVRL